MRQRKQRRSVQMPKRTEGYYRGNAGTYVPDTVPALFGWAHAAWYWIRRTRNHLFRNRKAW